MIRVFPWHDAPSNLRRVSFTIGAAAAVAIVVVLVVGLAAAAGMAAARGLG